MTGAAGFPPWAQLHPARRAHVERVVRLLDRWARAAGLAAGERDRWIRAGYLHDALRDAEPALLERLAPDAWGIAALRHGPAAARLAEEHGERDQGVLLAVRYHSVGYAGWDGVGRALYLADYLEPGRRFRDRQRRALRARVPADLDGVLRQVAADRLAWVLVSGRRLLAESVEFWNALVGSS